MFRKVEFIVKYSDSGTSSSAFGAVSRNFLQRHKRRIAIILSILGLVALVVVIHHFNSKGFDLDGSRYTSQSVQGDTAFYQARFKPPIEVRRDSSGREIRIKDQTYRITEGTYSGSEEGVDLVYTVAYPNGSSRQAAVWNGFLVNLDGRGEPIIMTVSASSTDKPSDANGRSAYTAAQLVAAAYPQFHEKPGNPAIFVALLLLAAFGGCLSRYRRFQDFLFKLRGSGLWVRDPEPSEFYYAMSRFGGMAILVGALFASLFQL